MTNNNNNNNIIYISDDDDSDNDVFFVTESSSSKFNTLMICETYPYLIMGEVHTKNKKNVYNVVVFGAWFRQLSII